MNVGTPFYETHAWLAIILFAYITQLHNAYGTAPAWELGSPDKYYVKSYSMLLD